MQNGKKSKLGSILLGIGAEALRKEYTGALMQARRVMDALQLPGAQ